MCIIVSAWQVLLCVTTLERETSLTDTTTYASPWADVANSSIELNTRVTCLALKKAKS